MAFIDRIVEYPGRVILTDVDSGTAQTVDVTRAEGTVTEAGTLLNATNLNQLTQVDQRLVTELENYLDIGAVFDSYQNDMSNIMSILLHGVRLHNYGQWDALELIDKNKTGKYIKIAWTNQQISVSNVTASTPYGGYRSPSIAVTMPVGLFTETPSVAFGMKNSANSLRLMNVTVDSKTQLSFYTSSAESLSGAFYFSFLVIGTGTVGQ